MIIGIVQVTASDGQNGLHVLHLLKSSTQDRMRLLQACLSDLKHLGLLLTFPYVLA